MATESKPLSLGVSCPSFSLKAVDGKTLSLDSLQASRVLVVGFTCNHCPYVQAYEGRLNALVKDYAASPVSFVCINSNDEAAYPEDSYEQMQQRAREKGFLFHYLHDQTQEVARAFYAECTPEFYVYDAERKLRYHGRLDDSPKNPAAVTQTFLKNAIEDLLNSRPVAVAQTPALGCSIKWKS